MIRHIYNFFFPNNLRFPRSTKNKLSLNLIKLMTSYEGMEIGPNKINRLEGYFSWGEPNHWCPSPNHPKFSFNFNFGIVEGYKRNLHHGGNLQIEIYLNFSRIVFLHTSLEKFHPTHHVTTYKTVHVTTRVLLEQITWLIK